MRFLRNLPIKHKLIGLTVGISGLALLLACAVFAFYEQAVFRRAMARDFAILADMFDDNVASGLAFNDPASIEQTLKTLSANPRIVAACVYNKEGAVAGAYRRAGTGGGGGFAFPPAQPTSQRFGAERLDTFKDIELAGERIGVVYIGAELAELRERAWRYVTIVGLLLVGCSLVALVLASRLQRIISQPIEDLAQTVATVAAEKNYAARAHKQNADELGRLVDGFNEMLGQIQARDSALQSSRDKLEERVAERTRDLQQENAERKQAEERLAQEHDLSEAILNNMPNLFYLFTEKGRLLRWNRRFETVSGYTGEELVRMHPLDSFPPEEKAAVAEHIVQVFKTGHGQVEANFLTKQGEQLPFHFTGGTVVVDGQPCLAGVGSDITERKRSEAELATAHRELVRTSRQAGMAEVATSVLHNVGNALNSVNVSATLVAEHVRHSKGAGVAKLATLLGEHQADLAEFLTADPRGRIIPGYLATLTDSLAEEQNTVIAELDLLRKNIGHIKDIVATQQSLAGNSGFTEQVSLAELVEDALRMNASSLARHDVEVVRDFQLQPVISTDKHKIVQILMNLVRNAKFACNESGRPGRQITVRISGDERSVQISVSDNGVGIPAENLLRIFNHGFTTRKTGHGFGLHSGALAARELGGSLHVQSAGVGHGATFTLELPVSPRTPAS